MEIESPKKRKHENNVVATPKKQKNNEGKQTPVSNKKNTPQNKKQVNTPKNGKQKKSPKEKIPVTANLVDEDDEEASKTSDEEELIDAVASDSDVEEDSPDNDDEEQEAAPKKNGGPKQKNPHRKYSTIEATLKVNDLFDKGEDEEYKNGQRQFNVFVKNLPNDVTKEDLMKHFRGKPNITQIIIPNELPRVAYITFANKDSFIKGLFRHRSFLKDRRIVVRYSIVNYNKNPIVNMKIRGKNLLLSAIRINAGLDYYYDKTKETRQPMGQKKRPILNKK